MNRYCSNCGKTCEHIEIVKQKKSPYGKSRKEQFKAFISGFISGAAVGGALASLELIDRYVQCTQCRHLTLENKGEEFQ
ncbi:hypothetical protein BIY22_00725 [Vibrio panuliri]|uniref:Pullulanase n=1 Tax=Vibrio panuliri TaxID=1381081 RepID=A0A1Q9HQ99_9VIBR|nr:hypothetical protein [Vibrio panuliri]KAB1457921.1 hypothetical protein F7O85_09375 [Vibrio panuliri]OLQ93049.1 hypothetical protein BIY22_00725 [Vibrio panuliri]OLQ95624.1 hypothetical protein BIY20_06165 [Vibrio panuliri]